MKVKAACKSCKEDIILKSTVSDRYRLSKKHGEEIALRCRTCNSEFDYHVDEFRAFGNKKMDFIIFLILLGATALVFTVTLQYLSFISALIMLFPSIVWLIISNSRAKRVINFNRYKLRGHLSSVEWE